MTAPSPEGLRSLVANVVANYGSQVFGVVLGVIVTPFFLGRLGAEAYGLVGFFGLLVAWFQILDSGLSLTVVRDTALFRAGALDAASLRRLFFGLEAIFVVLAAVGALTVVLLAQPVARSWLRPEHLTAGVVGRCVLLMGLAASLQLLCGLYRGVITGFEHQIWLSALNAGMAALRLGGGAAVVALLSVSPPVFFSYQLLVAIIELGLLLALARRTLPRAKKQDRRLLSLADARRLMTFSGSLALAVTTWALATQVDKLVLSRTLTLSSYAMFSLAVMAANGVWLLAAAVSQVLLPRLTMVAQKGDDQLLSLYRRATRLTCLVAVPCGLVLACFPSEVIWVWTGNPRAVAVAAPILTPYAAGNVLATVGAFPYYLQYARGNLRWHVAGSLGFVALLVPAFVFTALRFGPVGTGFAWLCANALFLLIWTPILHARFAPGTHWTWMARDVAPSFAAGVAAAWILSKVISWPADRVSCAVLLVVAGLVLLAATAIASGSLRVWPGFSLGRFVHRLRVERK